jgi:hypothetical protein
MLRAIKSFVTDYLSRHRNNVDRILHIIGVPLAFFGIFLVCTGRWKPGLINIFTGYLLQWVGHTYFEKNEVGEWILIKKIAGKLAGR